MIRIGIDVGGTFTDLVATDERSGEALHFKLPSNPHDPAAAIADGVAVLLGRAGGAGEAIGFLGHGTTVVTNLIIERRGPATALLTTAGFRDVLEIGRQTRPDLYDYTVERPPPLVKSSFPRKWESRANGFAASPGPPLSRRFRGGDGLEWLLRQNSKASTIIGSLRAAAIHSCIAGIAMIVSQ